MNNRIVNVLLKLFRVPNQNE